MICLFFVTYYVKPSYKTSSTCQTDSLALWDAYSSPLTIVKPSYKTSSTQDRLIIFDSLRWATSSILISRSVRCLRIQVVTLHIHVYSRGVTMPIYQLIATAFTFRVSLYISISTGVYIQFRVYLYISFITVSIRSIIFTSTYQNYLHLEHCLCYLQSKHHFYYL